MRSQNWLLAKSSKNRLRCDKYEAINHFISECRKVAQKGVQEKTWLSGEGDPLGSVQEI